MKEAVRTHRESRPSWRGGSTEVRGQVAWGTPTPYPHQPGGFMQMKMELSCLLPFAKMGTWEKHVSNKFLLNK